MITGSGPGRKKRTAAPKILRLGKFWPSGAVVEQCRGWLGGNFALQHQNEPVNNEKRFDTKRPTLYLGVIVIYFKTFKIENASQPTAITDFIHGLWFHAL